MIGKAANYRRALGRDMLLASNLLGFIIIIWKHVERVADETLFEERAVIFNNKTYIILQVHKITPVSEMGKQRPRFPISHLIQ